MQLTITAEQQNKIKALAGASASVPGTVAPEATPSLQHRVARPAGGSRAWPLWLCGRGRADRGCGSGYPASSSGRPVTCIGFVDVLGGVHGGRSSQKERRTM